MARLHPFAFLLEALATKWRCLVLERCNETLKQKILTNIIDFEVALERMHGGDSVDGVSVQCGFTAGFGVALAELILLIELDTFQSCSCKITQNNRIQRMNNKLTNARHIRKIGGWRGD